MIDFKASLASKPCESCGDASSYGMSLPIQNRQEPQYVCQECAKELAFRILWVIKQQQSLAESMRPDGLQQEILRLKASGQKIEAFKYYRLKTGCSLRMAHDYVESF